MLQREWVTERWAGSVGGVKLDGGVFVQGGGCRFGVCTGLRCARKNIQDFETGKF